jgi:hypothetical protein
MLPLLGGEVVVRMEKCSLAQLSRVEMVCLLFFLMEFSEISSSEATTERALFEKILLSKHRMKPKQRRQHDSAFPRSANFINARICFRVLRFYKLHEMILLEWKIRIVLRLRKSRFVALRYESAWMIHWRKSSSVCESNSFLSRRGCELFKQFDFQIKLFNWCFKPVNCS